MLIRPVTEDDLQTLCLFFAEHGVPFYLLGGGSNLVIADRGVRGAVLSLSAINSIRIENQARGDSEFDTDCAVHVRSGAGVAVDDLVRWCRNHGLAGMERFSGLPGSVGGAVFMNARCYDTEIADIFFSAKNMVFSLDGCTLEETAFRAQHWSYKKSPFQDRCGSSPFELTRGGQCILSAVFSLYPGETDWLDAEMSKYVADRTDKGHFRYPSAGSMFKNNHCFGMPSGKIIDEAGLRGFRIGGACVAPWHGNIVINDRGACAADVRSLVEQVRDAVRVRTGFDLECEVIFAGDW